MPFQSETSGAGAFLSTQWNSTSFVTTVQVGSVPASASVPAGMLWATSSVLISWSAAIATPGTAIASAAMAMTTRREMRRGRRAARARSGGRQVGGGGPLEAVAECGELRVELAHEVISVELGRCLRRVLRPRDTRARTAWGVVSSCSAASS